MGAQSVRGRPALFLDRLKPRDDASAQTPTVYFSAGPANLPVQHHAVFDVVSLPIGGHMTGPGMASTMGVHPDSFGHPEAVLTRLGHIRSSEIVLAASYQGSASLRPGDQRSVAFPKLACQADLRANLIDQALDVPTGGD